tara:strand:- start:5085 stop:5729 length:645 start_codon:yes stop_codon:yes gene_type:complete
MSNILSAINKSEIFWEHCVFESRFISQSGIESVQNATFNGDAAITTVTGQRFSKILTLDGTGDYIDYGDTTRLTDNFSVEAVIKYSATQNTRGIISRANGSDEGWMLGINASGNLSFPVWNTGADSDSVPTNDVWIHVLCVQDSGTNIMYIDGVVQATTDTNVVESITGEEFVVGRIYASIDDFYFNGDIAFVRIWNRVITASEAPQLSSTEGF